MRTATTYRSASSPSSPNCVRIADTHRQNQFNQCSAISRRWPSAKPGQTPAHPPTPRKTNVPGQSGCQTAAPIARRRQAAKTSRPGHQSGHQTRRHHCQTPCHPHHGPRQRSDVRCCPQNGRYCRCRQNDPPRRRRPRCQNGRHCRQIGRSVGRCCHCRQTGCYYRMKNGPMVGPRR